MAHHHTCLHSLAHLDAFLCGPSLMFKKDLIAQAHIRFPIRHVFGTVDERSVEPKIRTRFDPVDWSPELDIAIRTGFGPVD